MSTNAYCSGCGRRVQVTATGECSQGHARSMLRDVREGALPADVRDAATGNARPLPTAATGASHDEVLAQVLGKGIVIVPVTLVVAFGVWTGYYQFPGSPAIKLLLSIGSLALTVGLAFLWAGIRRKRH